MTRVKTELDSPSQTPVETTQNSITITNYISDIKLITQVFRLPISASLDRGP